MKKRSKICTKNAETPVLFLHRFFLIKTNFIAYFKKKLKGTKTNSRRLFSFVAFFFFSKKKESECSPVGFFSFFLSQNINSFVCFVAAVRVSIASCGCERGSSQLQHKGEKEFFKKKNRRECAIQESRKRMRESKTKTLIPRHTAVEGSSHFFPLKKREFLLCCIKTLKQGQRHKKRG